MNWTTTGSYDIHSKKESVVYSLPSLLFKEQRETGRDHIGSIVVFFSNKSNVINSLETTERRIKEFERHANIDITLFSTSSTR